jgi:hypothetical protein
MSDNTYLPEKPEVIDVTQAAHDFYKDIELIQPTYQRPEIAHLIASNIGPIYLNTPFTENDTKYYTLYFNKLTNNIIEKTPEIINKFYQIDTKIINDIKKTLNEIKNNNNQLYKIFGIKLPIFNIYDNQIFLNEKYGSSQNEFLTCAYHYNHLMNHNKLEEILFYYSDSSNVIDNLALLKYFFFEKSCTYKSLILSLGSKYHGTCLYLKKIENSDLIKVVHINTGLGINTSNITINDKTYYNIFENCIYLTPEMLFPFMTFLKPFFFFRQYDINNKEYKSIYIISVFSNYIERLLNYEVNLDYMPLFYNSKCNNIHDYYVYMFSELKKQIFTFDYLNDIFNPNNFKKRMTTLSLSYKPEQLASIQQENIIFLQNIKSNWLTESWDKAKTAGINENKDNINKQNYIIKSFENIDFHIDNNLLYITAQIAGTCVFKSLLLSIMHHLIFTYNEQQTSPFNSYLYLYFSSYCFDMLNAHINSNNIEKDYIEQTINASKIYNKLISDKIIDNSFSLNALIISDNKKNSENSIYYTINNNMFENNKNWNISNIPLENLDSLLTKIRMQHNNIHLLTLIHDIILGYIKNDIFDDVTRSYFELFFIGFLWEFYYNQTKWEDKLNEFEFNYSNLLYIDLLSKTSHRLILTENEINWICKLYVYFGMNYGEINNTDVIKHVIDLDTLIKSYNNMFPEELIIKELTISNDIFASNYKTSAKKYINSRNTKIIDNSDYIHNYIKDTQLALILFLDFMFIKNNLQTNFYIKINYLLDNDISNINRFIINYLKQPDNDFYIELENSINILQMDLKIKELYERDNQLNEENNSVKNLFVIESFIQVYNIYNLYLTYDEKYKFIKNFFINCKILTSYPNIDKFVNIIKNLLILLNTILHDLYIETIIDFKKNDNIKFSNGEYININASTLLFNDNGTIKKKYTIKDEKLLLYLYNNITELFKDNKPINKTAIDIIIDSFENNINTPYFKINKDNPELKDLIITNNVITSRFKKLKFRSMFLFGNILLNDNNNVVFINEERTYLVFVLRHYNYKDSNMQNDVVIAFNIEPSSAMSFKLKTQNIMYINGNFAYLENTDIIYIKASLENYPFMIYGSNDSINIIEKQDNNYILHCISNSLNFSANTLYKIIYEKVDNYYINYQIKQNFLTPYININKNKYINTFYDIHTPRSEYIKNIFQNVIINPFVINPDENKMIELNNLPGVNVLSDINDFAFKQINVMLNKINNKVTDIINTVLKSESIPYSDLITWINNNSENSIKRYGEVEGKGDFQCDLDCRIINEGPFRLKLRHITKTLITLRKVLCNKLDHSYETYLLFMYNNYMYCNFIMQVNIYISSITRLLNALKTCEPVLCHELIEINQVFLKKTHNVSTLCGMVEIVFGNMIKNEQWEKILDIYKNYTNKAEEKWQVHQFMMGKGKSSIITPMLIVMLYFDNINKGNKEINLLVPEHLKKQTINTLYEYNLFFGSRLTILTDSEIKLKFLDKDKSLTDSIILIDEFDFMYNPVQSNFNKIEFSEELNPELIKVIFKTVHSILFGKSKFESSKPYDIISEIVSIVNNKLNIKHVTYGMSNIDKNRYCIPYLRKDSPNEGSKFSSILYTIVLTILYFYNPQYEKYILEKKDLIFAFNYKKLLRILLNIFDIDISLSLEGILHEYEKYTIDNIPAIPINVMELYLINIFTKLKKSTIIKNCSFIDIINMESSWQVGYSGTVNIDMNIKPLVQYNKYDINIVRDDDESLNVRLALYNTNIHQIAHANDIFELFVVNNYNVLIDACALLKDYDNKEVVEKIYNLILEKQQTRKTIIYLLKDDTKMIYNGNHLLYEEKIYKTEEVVYYYSQRHTVGIDFKQPNILMGLVLLNSYNIYTDVSQAIYRMRKLNKGHSIHIGYFNNNNNPCIASQQIYDMIKQNELDINNQNKLLLLYQYLKYYVRKKFTHQYYEVDLDTLIDINTKEPPTIAIVKNKIARNVFNVMISPDIFKKIKDPNFKNRDIDFDSSLSQLYQIIINYDLNDLLKVVFNTNTTQIEIVTEIQKETQKQIQIQKEITNKIYSDNQRYSIKFNPFLPIDNFIHEFTYSKIIFDNGNTLLFSYNLNKNISNIDSAIIVKFTETIYMLEHSSLLNHYIYIAEVYSLNGIFINNFIFNKTKEKINFDKIFNYNLQSDDGREFNLSYILFGMIDDLVEIKVQKVPINIMNDLDKLVYLSNINIFNTDEPIIIEIIKRFETSGNVTFTLYESNEAFTQKINMYMSVYYTFVSRDYKITDNDKIMRRKRHERITEFHYDLAFKLYETTELEYYTIAA